jgi:hypothetical protein
MIVSYLNGDDVDWIQATLDVFNEYFVRDRIYLNTIPHYISNGAVDYVKHYMESNGWYFELTLTPGKRIIMVTEKAQRYP